MTHDPELIVSPEHADLESWHDFHGVDGLENASSITSAALEGDWNAFSMTADGALAGLELLNLAVNPFGALLSMGIEFLVEYLGGRHVIDLITGDPVAVSALAQTWANVAQELLEASDDYERALNAISGWSSDSAAAYRRTVGQVIATLRGTAAIARDAGKGVMYGGMMVATTRLIVIDLLAWFVRWAVTTYVSAKLLAGPTYGSSLLAWLATAIGQAAMLSAKIVIKLLQLMQASELYSAKFRGMGDSASRLAATSHGAADHIGSYSGPA